MTPRIAKTATIGAIAVAVAVVLLAYLAVGSSASAQTATSSSTSTTSQTSTSNSQSAPCAGHFQGNQGPFQWGGAPPGGPMQQSGWFGQYQSQVNLTIGQTITVTSTSGEYRTVGTSSTNGTASGTITFTVTGKLSEGYTLSLTSGSLTIAGTTYTISSGSAQMDPTGTTISGQGTTSPTGEFILHATAHGTFVGTSASVSLDFTNNTTEYHVILSGNVQG